MHSYCTNSLCVEKNRSKTTKNVRQAQKPVRIQVTADFKFKFN